MPVSVRYYLRTINVFDSPLVSNVRELIVHLKFPKAQEFWNDTRCEVGAVFCLYELGHPGQHKIKQLMNLAAVLEDKLQIALPLPISELVVG